MVGSDTCSQSLSQVWNELILKESSLNHAWLGSNGILKFSKFTKSMISAPLCIFTFIETYLFGMHTGRPWLDEVGTWLMQGFAGDS